MTAASKAVAPVAVSGGSFDPLAAVIGFFQRIGAARRAAAALAVDRRPDAEDLKTLGLVDIMFDFRNLPH